LILFIPLGFSGQDIPDQADVPKPEPVLLRITVYPTVNLSRYDYNNDVDLTEIRTYVELRDQGLDGPVIEDAVIKAQGEKLEFIRDHYEKRIRLAGKEQIDEMNLSIRLPDGRSISETFPLPDWLILTAPRPAVVPSTQDLKISWKYSRFDSPVDVFAYNFKTGEEICSKRHLSQNSVTLTQDKLPGSTIIRIWVMQSWLNKRFFFGDEYARGSEILVIPWSQVFIRTE